MELVKCEMCEKLYELNEWKKGNCFICKICAKILSYMVKHKLPYTSSQFDALRLLYDNNKDFETIIDNL